MTCWTASAPGRKRSGSIHAQFAALFEVHRSVDRHGWHPLNDAEIIVTVLLQPPLS